MKSGGAQAAAAETNENLATPVPQHVPLASIKSESPPDSNGQGRTPERDIMDYAHTPPARARAPSGSEEDSDEEDDDGSDSGSSPSLSE